MDLFKTIYIILLLEGLAVHWWAATDVLPKAGLGKGPAHGSCRMSLQNPSFHTENMALN
jgi:hypothetical protein